MNVVTRIILSAVFAICLLPKWAEAQSEPGGDAAATEIALKNPDEFAWILFLYLNQPARTDTAGIPDSAKKFGTTDGVLVWESWALASGGEFSEVYPMAGRRPVDWEKLQRNGTRKMILERSLKREAVLNEMRSRMAPKASAKFFPPSEIEGTQEVRANRSTYEFIIRNEMYHQGGLEALLTKARAERNRQLISFDPAAKEVKVDWRPIAEAQKSRYLWREVVDSATGTKVVWGLVAFHVITKDLPNWFWADFGHVDCESRENACNDPNQEPALTTPVDRTTRGSNAASGANGVRKETKGTVFENYILRGTQIDFISPQGVGTILSNPVIENGFQVSSCMTCHARASVGPLRTGADGKPFPSLNKLAQGNGTLGIPNPAAFGAGPDFSPEQILYLQTDFIWSASFRAKRQEP